ncbi:hypothetical protein NU219Hw_g4065t1 [Hortaea werneckii]
MDPNEAAIEADLDVDNAALQQEQARQHQRQGQVKAQHARGGVDIDGADEGSPLLPQRSVEDEDAGVPQWSEDYSHLPWYKRPSIFWVMPPFFLMTLAFGGVLAPKVNLITDLICREYYLEKQLLDPNFTTVPVDFNGGENDQCEVPEVASRVSLFTLWGSLIAGLLSALSSPKLGSLSDRYGRKTILIITSFGTIASEVITIFAATYPETFPVSGLLVGYAFDGLTGSFIVAMAIANSYATDCTPPAARNVAFGYFHICLFLGIALGPIAAGYMVKATGQVVIVFYVLTAVHTFFVLFIGLVVPESLSKKRQMQAREKRAIKKAETAASSDWIQSLRSLNILEPLKIFWPTGPGSSPRLRWNLVVLAAVDTICFGVAMGSMTVVLVYIRYEFGWKTFEEGRFMTIVNSCRVFCLLAILPALTRLVRGKADPAKKNTGSDRFDLNVIRVAVFFDMLGYLGYTLSRQGGPFIMSGVLAAIGGIGPPTLQSALTKHVPAEQTGQLLGASGLLHALARVVAPTVFQAIFSSTVGKFTQTVFVCLTATFGLAFVLSWFIMPGVYFHEELAAEGAEGDGSAQGRTRHDEHAPMPVVTPISDTFDHTLKRVGLRRKQT